MNEKSDDAKIKFAKNSIKKLREKILVGSTTNQNKLINEKIINDFVITFIFN